MTVLSFFQNPLIAPADAGNAKRKEFFDHFLSRSKFAALFSDAFLPFFHNNAEEEEEEEEKLELSAAYVLADIDFLASDTELSVSLQDFFDKWLNGELDIDQTGQQNHTFEVNTQHFAGKGLETEGTETYHVGGSKGRADITIRLRGKNETFGIGEIKTIKCDGNPIFQILH